MKVIKYSTDWLTLNERVLLDIIVRNVRIIWQFLEILKLVP